MAEYDGDKTEPATARRREEARQEGNVSRSNDLTAAAMLLAAVLLLHVFGMQFMGSLKEMLQTMLGGQLTPQPAQPDDVRALMVFALRLVAQGTAPFLLGLMAVGLAVASAQVGIRITPQVLRLDLTKLTPWRGLSGLFDARGRIRLAMSAAKVCVVFGIAAWFALGDLPRIVVLANLEALPLFAVACQIVYALALKLALLLLLLAAADFAYQIWQRERDLRMTKQEVKEELKRMEGDPLVKQRRTRVARQLALQRINSAVPRAQVIVTNPTHYAIALQYDSQSMRAPKVVAKGADFLALRIRQLAALHEVPIVERRELARALYRAVEVGQEIPPQYYNAVAEVLAYVYRLSGRKIA